jgi:hypothetical protein
MSNNSQQTGLGFLGIAVGLALQDDPAANTGRAQEAALAAQQQRQAEEQRRAEVLGQQELARQRILGLLKGSEPTTALALKTDGSASSLVVTETRGAFGSTVVVPTGFDSPPAERGLQLKLGDDTDGASAKARQGFDTPGGFKLPDPPPTPTSSQNKADILKALRAKRDQNAKDRKFLDEILAALKNSPNPDPVAVSQVQRKIESNTQEKNELVQQIQATEQVTVGVDLSDDPSTK